MTLIEELKYRALLYAMTDEALEKELEDKSLTFYIGNDPSGDSLHIGHLSSLLVAKRLAQRGHKPIVLIGGGTGLIGDPSGKHEERQLLTLEAALANSEKIAMQVKKITPEATVVNNYEWLKNYDMITFLRDIGKHFGINAMLAKDSVKSRLETGISFTEFSYQIIQSLDFLELYRHHGCTLQIGGQDQWGNITAGLELIRKVEGADAKAYGMVMALITKEDGSKFGKTAGDAVWLDSKKTSPYAFYQYWINLSDGEAITRLKQFTMMTKDAIETIAQAMQESPHLRHAQKALAKEVTQLVHGDQALKQVENITQALFYNDVSKLTIEEIQMGFEGVQSAEVTEDIILVDALITLNLAASKREAKTFITSNAVTVNGEKVADLGAVLKKENALHTRYTIIKRGKKLYGVLKHK